MPCAENDYMKKEDEKTRLVEKQEIYIDCTMLLKQVHKSIYDMPKKDRVVVGDWLMNYVLSMLSHFSHAWNFADVRVAETEKFLFCYYEFRSLARMCSGERKEELNIIKITNYSAIAEYMERIEKGIGKWRKSVRSRKTPAGIESNNVDVSGNDKPRGGERFI